MPLWPAAPLLLIVVPAYGLTQQTAKDLVITGAIVVASLA